MIVRLFRDERGMTTVGMAVALLVTLALVFSTAQVYRVSSASAEIQEVADAAALAAENEVAEFMIAVRLCDATVLSMSLLSVAMYGVSVAAALVPGGQGVATKLAELAGGVLKARNGFAEKAAAGLNALQKALPFISAANAAGVASANNEGGASAGEYFAVAMLVPSKGENIVAGAADGVGDLAQSVEASQERLSEIADEAEEAARQANAAKIEGFMADVGKSPEPCLYERAGKLGGLVDADNPFYESPDTWSFEVPLKRAQTYYAARLANEKPLSSDAGEVANSVLRARFYAYATDRLSHGYVHETENSFDAYFPPIFRNTAEMRQTELYTEKAYPVTSEGDALKMHAWPGCPGIAAGEGKGNGSLQQLDVRPQDYVRCGCCEFSVESMGNVASASTNVENGFEHHYLLLSQAAKDYGDARGRLDPLVRQAKDTAQPLFDKVGELAKSLGSMRIDAVPPGAFGAVALVVNTHQASADEGFETLFVSGGYTLGARAAVSGATLVADTSGEGRTVITQLLDGLKQDGGAATGAARIVLDAWSGLLGVYAEGQKQLTDSVRSALEGIPGIKGSASGLGDWAVSAFNGVIEAVGLEPAELDALKPVLVNTAHVAGADDGAFSVRFMEAKTRALSLSSGSTDLFSAIVGDFERDAYDLVERVEGGLVVAEIEMPVTGDIVPITIALPAAATDAAYGLVERCADAVRSVIGSVTGIKVWS